jgi:hypothetical protein
MPRKQPPKEYYTATQVKNKLGISDGMLHTYVQKGRLQRIIPAGRKQGFYLRNEVDQLANELNTFFATRTQNTSTFAKATEEDIKGIVELTRVLFGLRESVPATVERRKKWIRKNPDIFYVLKVDGQVIGYAAFLPLKPEKIEKILREEEFSQDLTAEDIEKFHPGKPVHLYYSAIAVKTDMSRAERRIYGARLINGVLNALIELGKRGIVIETVTARSDTADGIRLMRHLGLTEITSNTDKRNFVLRVAESAIPEILPYKQALQESGIFNKHSKQAVANKSS